MIDMEVCSLSEEKAREIIPFTRGNRCISTQRTISKDEGQIIMIPIPRHTGGIDDAAHARLRQQPVFDRQPVHAGNSRV